ncbi:hypothetical protein MP638_001698, partial [Amoeboaphelidium occidentale]
MNNLSRDYAIKTETLRATVDGQEVYFDVTCPLSGIDETVLNVSTAMLLDLGVSTPKCLQYISPLAQKANREKFSTLLYSVYLSVNSNPLLSGVDFYGLIKDQFVGLYGERPRQAGEPVGFLTLGEHAELLRKDGTRFSSTRGKGAQRDSSGKVVKGPPIGHNFKCASCSSVYSETEVFESFFGVCLLPTALVKKKRSWLVPVSAETPPESRDEADLQPFNIEMSVIEDETSQCVSGSNSRDEIQLTSKSGQGSSRPGLALQPNASSLSPAAVSNDSFVTKVLNQRGTNDIKKLKDDVLRLEIELRSVKAQRDKLTGQVDTLLTTNAMQAKVISKFNFDTPTGDGGHVGGNYDEHAEASDDTGNRGAEFNDHGKGSDYRRSGSPSPPPLPNYPDYGMFFVSLPGVSHLSFECMKDNLKKSQGRFAKWVGCNDTLRTLLVAIPNSDVEGVCFDYLMELGYKFKRTYFAELVEEKELLTSLFFSAIKNNKKEAEEFLMEVARLDCPDFDFESKAKFQLATEREVLAKVDYKQNSKKHHNEYGNHSDRHGRNGKRGLNSGKENYSNKRHRKYSIPCAPEMALISGTANHLRVFYANIQGGLSYKVRPLLETFGKDFDVLILVETWFDEAGIESYRPWLVTHSPMRPQDHASIRAGRPHSGIIVLARPELKQTVSKIKQCPYSVAVMFDRTVVLGLYLPPSSLSTDGVKDVLKGHNSMFPDIVIGDLNCHPVNDGSKRSRVVIETICNKWGLEYIQPVGGSIKHDHVFARPRLKSKSWLIEPLPIRTDHPKGIGLNVSCQSKKRDTVVKDIVRFNLHKLQDEKCVVMLRSVYASKVCNGWLSNFKQDMKDGDFKEFIESQYNFLVTSFTSACDKALGRKRLIDNVARPEKRTSLTNEPVIKSISHIAKEFKRGRQVRQNYTLVSRDTDMTVFEDVKEFFMLRFEDPKEQVTVDLPIDPDDNFAKVSKTWFSRASVRKAIVSYSSNKSCGGDGIHILLLKSLLETHLVEHLQRLFHVIVLYGYTPKAWNEVVTFPLPKVQPENGTVTIDECRPIGLVPVIRRIFEQCLFTFLEEHIETKRKLRCHYSQAGFLRGSSTVAQALVAHDSLVLRKIIHVFIDIKHAYDSVLFSMLADELEQRRLPLTVQKLIGCLYGPFEMSVALNGKTTDKIKAHKGLIQGGKGSPMLWNLYADPLYCSINPSRDTICPIAMGWADDQLLQIKREEIEDAQYYLDE